MGTAAVAGHGRQRLPGAGPSPLRDFGRRWGGAHAPREGGEEAAAAERQQQCKGDNAIGGFETLSKHSATQHRSVIL